MAKRFYLDVAGLHGIWLLQRLECRKDGTGGQGIDQFFSMDYMGSAEFEFGALPEALKRWREKGIPTEPIHIKFCKDQFSASFVGPKALVPRIQKFLEMEVDAPGENHLKEMTRLRYVYRPEDDYSVDTVGWWDIDNDFAFFTKAKYAHQFIEGLKGGKK